MRPLSSLRDGWDAIEEEEVRLLRSMPIHESVREYLALRAEFEPWLREAEAREGDERLARLAELQDRLRRLDQLRLNGMEGLLDALIAMQGRLDHAGIPSIAIGGIAVGVWGRARLTRDVDLKVLLDRDSRRRLLDVLLPDCTPLHADPDAALRFNGILFVRDPAGVRIDFALADTEFDEVAVSRGRAVELAPGKIGRVCSPEDLIILKLISTRERDAGDAASVISRQGDELDDGYLLDWLTKLEQALADSTIVRTYRQMREKHK
ncbi:MAG: hypothetical protein HY260_18765 [Chloroflexi bacterium]|nr:hypothetical protein [Chloroflexota bacterium]